MLKCDRVQTRIQNQDFGSKAGGITDIKDLIKNEGVGAFFKGLTPKVLFVLFPSPLSDPDLTGSVRSVVGPKLVFSFTLAQSLIPFFSKMLN